jgi:hypothetical protein
MPSLENLMECEGSYELGTLDDTRYCWMDIVVAVKPDGTITPVCMKDDWQRTQQYAQIQANTEIRQLSDDLIAYRNKLSIADEKARRVPWLESEVARLTHDLARYRQQEAAQRSVQADEPRIGAYEVQQQRDCDTSTPARCSLSNTPLVRGVCQCSWCVKVRKAGEMTPNVTATAYRDGRAWNDVRWTNSHIAPEAPIFRKLCQCDDCREMRAVSGYPAAEIEGH